MRTVMPLLCVQHAQRIRSGKSLHVWLPSPMQIAHPLRHHPQHRHHLGQLRLELLWLRSRTRMLCVLWRALTHTGIQRQLRRRRQYACVSGAMP